VAELRALGPSWRDIAQALHVPRRTLTRAWALEHNPGRVPVARAPSGRVGGAKGSGCAP
jgi:hypothetical protein